MKEKIYKIYNKYKIAIISTIVVLLLIFLLYMIFSRKISLKTLETENYNLVYDTGWKVKKKTDNYIKLKHKEEATLEINIINLKEEERYSTIDYLIDEVVEVLNNKNKNYKLIKKAKNDFKQERYECYKLLYESDDSESLVMVYKISDKLIVSIYSAKMSIFDILLDSVNNINSKFTYKEKDMQIEDSFGNNLKNITFEKNIKLDKLINKTNKYLIANNNQEVKFSIPNIFTETNINSMYKTFKYEEIDNKKSIKINSHIYLKNIYEYIGEDLGTIFSKYEYYHDKENFKEELVKYDKKKNLIIYKNSYISELFDKKYIENVHLIFPISKSSIFEIEVNCENYSLTQKFIDSINVLSVNNYATFTDTNKSDGYINGILKNYVDYSYKSIREIEFKVPDKYIENSRSNDYNIYDERRFSLNYHDDYDLFDYDIRISLEDKNLEGKIDSVNKDLEVRTNSTNLTDKGNIKLNDKQFHLYSGFYEDVAGIPLSNIGRKKYKVEKQILCYELPKNDYGREMNVYIEINGNGKTITNEIQNEVTNFIINDKLVNKKEGI